MAASYLYETKVKSELFHPFFVFPKLSILFILCVCGAHLCCVTHVEIRGQFVEVDSPLLGLGSGEKTQVESVLTH